MASGLKKFVNSNKFCFYSAIACFSLITIFSYKTLAHWARKLKKYTCLEPENLLVPENLKGHYFKV